ncbi:DUF948 domain-containing protein [Paenibacillus filicis]|uniref:DUF948 domain-containing protein n=1 Tax=Paenibacillus gyeongsangnamensis TaxID=3388067 RepID=A0ABT4QH78_9BACL|nr:DUF948 domain-containing protein [Paenibacillus filicis]MCZ8516228.1 DUF948 domain-containing protein [Paenibacillus filicis]
MIIEISVAVVAIAFVALVIFLIQTLRNVSELLAQTNVTMKELQTQMNGISAEATELLRHTNEVTVDVRNKLHSLDPAVHSIKHIGDAVSEVTSSFKQASATVADTIHTQVEHSKLLKDGAAAGLIQAVPIAVGLWERFRGKKISPLFQPTADRLNTPNGRTGR